MKQVKTKQRYTTGGNPVRLTITFGNAQMGTSRLLVGSQMVGIGDFQAFPLTDIQGKTLSIKSTVTDISNQTDNLDATYLLEGGPGLLEFSLEAVAEANGKSVDFNADIDFS